VRYVDNIDAAMLPLFSGVVAAMIFTLVSASPVYGQGSKSQFVSREILGKYADNLKSLRGLRFDWARNDGNHDPVYADQAFTHTLNEFGIVHEAEEYNGVWGSGNWGAEGRVATEMLPFFARKMVFVTGQ
jgi:hypothetical protein